MLICEKYMICSVDFASQLTFPAEQIICRTDRRVPLNSTVLWVSLGAENSTILAQCDRCAMRRGIPEEPNATRRARSSSPSCSCPEGPCRPCLASRPFSSPSWSPCHSSSPSACPSWSPFPSWRPYVSSSSCSCASQKPDRLSALLGALN